MGVPEKLGRYEILEELGKGAMGVVYLGRDPLIGRQLALKTFRLGYSAGDQELEQFRERFLREAQSAGILSHSNIVAIHDVAVDPGGDFFIAMEYVEGTDLKILMQRQGRLDLRFVVEAVAQIADGLDYAHSKGVVHRDIKPANIIITAADKQAKITDFGIARVEASNLTVEGQLLGTPNYMAPEQIQGKEVDYRADIFSLGVMLYELVTGKKPFAAPNLSAVTHKIVFEPFPPPEELVPGLPEGLRRVLDRALAKDPAQRYGRGAEMAADLRAVFARPAAAEPAARRGGSFLEGPPAPIVADATTVALSATPPAGVPAAGVPVAGVPVADTTVASASAAGVPVADTTVAGASASAVAGAPAAGVPAAPAPAAPQATGTATLTPSAAPTAAAPPPETLPAAAGGMPVAGRVAAAIGLVIALSLIGVVIFRLMAGDGEAPTTDVAELQSGAPAGEPAPGPVPSASGASPGEVSVEERLDAARTALRARDYPTAIRFVERVLAVDPEHQEAKDLFTQASEGQRRREEIGARLRGGQPAQQQEPATGPSKPPPAAGTAPAPATSGQATSPQGEADGTLVVDLHSAVSEGRLTIFNGGQRIYKEPFKFVAGKGGIFGRQQKRSGSLRVQLTLPAGVLDLRIYVWPQGGAQTRTAEIKGNLPPGATRTLNIEVTDEGRVSVALE